MCVGRACSIGVRDRVVCASEEVFLSARKVMKALFDPVSKV